MGYHMSKYSGTGATKEEAINNLLHNMTIKGCYYIRATGLYYDEPTIKYRCGADKYEESAEFDKHNNKWRVWISLL